MISKILKQIVCERISIGRPLPIIQTCVSAETTRPSEFYDISEAAEVNEIMVK